MKKEIWLFSVLIAILITSQASASYKIDKNFTKIEKNYAADEFVKGKINISFSAQTNKDFTSNFDGGIKLFDLLINMSYSPGKDFFCNPLSCKNDYSAGISSETQKFTLEKNENEIYGFVLNGNIEGIQSFSLNITTNANASCKNQINVDLLNDGINDFYNDNYANELCGERNYGCFQKNTKAASDAILSKARFYCEKINLTAAPAYEVGAILTSENPKGTIQFIIYPETGGEYFAYGNKENPPSGEVKATLVPKPTPKKDFTALVCVKDASDSSNYRIKVKEGGANCGGSYDGIKFSANSDYEIFAQPMKYGSIQQLKIGGEQYSKALINDYLKKIYGNKCENGCVIPIKFNGEAQSATLHSGKVEYTSSGNLKETKNIYELKEKEFAITSNYTILDIEKMRFVVPSLNGSKEFKLLFDGEEIAKENIQIKKGFDFDLTPRTSLIGLRITFSAFGSKNITYSEWNFGDNTNKVISNDNRAEHIYLNESTYIIEVKLKSSDGEEATKKFGVVVGEPKKSANLTIERYKNRISDVKKDIAGFQSWTKTEIEKEVKLTEIESLFKSIKDKYELFGNNGTNDEYTAIINSLLNLKIPYSVSATVSGEKIPLEIGFNNIDLSSIAEISGKESENSEETKNAILVWYTENYDAKISFQTVSALYEDEQKKVLTNYKIELNKKPTSTFSDVSYLIIGYPLSSLIFKTSYDAKSVAKDRGAYIVISDSGQPNIIEFLIKSSSAPEVMSLGMYLSPVLSKLGASEKPFKGFYTAGGEFRWGFFLISLGIILILFLSVYLLLQHWYKRNYEKSLFKNPNDLYNLIYFIYNSRRSGIKDEDSRKKLLEKKWTKEQAAYAFKKIDGKRTGMWEIPVFKFLENKKVRQEIERKQLGVPVDVRFIKRQGVY